MKRDEELMIAYQNGDAEAFSVLFNRYSAKVYGYLHSRIKNRVQADDIFQAIFLKLHQSRQQYNAKYPFAPWLFTICRTIMTDNLRSEGRLAEKIGDHDISKIPAVEAVQPESPAELATHLEKLPENQRKAISLRYNEDLSFDEIGKRLNISQSNSRQLISRGIRTLRGVLVHKKRNE